MTIRNISNKTELCQVAGKKKYQTECYETEFDKLFSICYIVFRRSSNKNY